MSRIKELLTTFSYRQLETVLGSSFIEIIKVLDGDNSLQKERLIELVLKLDIEEYLKNRIFRTILLTKLSDDDLNELKKSISGKKTDTYNKNELIEEIANKPFNKSDNLTKTWYRILNLNYTEDYQVESFEAKQGICSESKFYELLDYQFMIKQKTLNFLKRNDIPRALIHMPTGTGKTKTAMHILTHHYLYDLKSEGIIIWMAHTEELIEQAINTFETTWKHIGKGSINIYRLYKNYNLDEDEVTSGIMFCGFQKLISIKKTKPKLFKKIHQRCRLLIVDEAHKSTAKETFGVINSLLIQKDGMLTRGLLGLSATPGRSMFDDSANKELVNAYDRNIINIDLDVLKQINKTVYEIHDTTIETDVIKYLQKEKILAEIIRVDLEYEGGISIDILREMERSKGGTGDFNDQFINKMGSVVNRNIAIVEKLCELSEKGYPTIVFACSVEHGKLISNALTVRGIKNRYVFGDSTAMKRKEAIREFKDRNNNMNILINYEVLTTGFDSTNIKCVFITRPTKSIVLYSQMLGRGLRGKMMGGNDACMLIDIKDNLDEYTSESMAFKYFNNYWA